jgi:hypothetical protein
MKFDFMEVNKLEKYETEKSSMTLFSGRMIKVQRRS